MARPSKASKGTRRFAPGLPDRDQSLPDSGERLAGLLPARANTQPAFAAYVQDGQTPIAHPGGLIVLTLRGAHISRITRFHYDHLFPRFGVPLELQDE